ncbi:MAG: GEVED domain-containing protein [Bacteroidia bacterium]|nr:GEVED domain-containing protein [Bacteroidia bacterium]
MNRFLIFLFILISILPQHELLAQEIVDGEIIIQLNEGEKWEDFVKKSPGIPFRLKNTLSRRMNIYLLGVEESVKPKAVLGKLKKHNSVYAAQFNHKVELRESQATFPQDSLFGNQWALDNTGQAGGIADADIDAPEAWDLSLGGTTVLGDTMVVAVIDDGFFLGHEDIHYWKNRAEIPNNGIDDDQNGYVDDYDGWNAYQNNGQIQPAAHGTEVAGIIGAISDNQIGIAGVGWRTAVMPIMGLSASEATVVLAYDYILNQRLLYEASRGAKGAFVVATNASFGINRGNPANFPIWCGIYDVLGEAGILSVAATANANLNVDQVGDIPTACTSEFLITVTSTDIQDQKVGGAAFGPISIDIGAPGNGILTTFLGNSYSTAAGTSFAAPVVAGVIPLMLGGACPGLASDYLNKPVETALLIKDYLLQGVDQKPSLLAAVRSKGRLNAFNAVSFIIDSCNFIPNDCVSPFRPLGQATSDSSISFSWQRYADSLLSKIRYREKGNGLWADSLIVSGTDTALQLLLPCTVYEWQVASSCGSGWSSYTPLNEARTLGCCKAPESIFFPMKTAASLSMSWGRLETSQLYRIDYREQGSMVWINDSTSDTALLISGLDPCTTYEIRAWSVCDREALDTLNLTATTLGCGGCTDFVYCQAEGGNTGLEWIDSLHVGNIALQSGINGGYGNFTGEIFSLLIDSAYNFFMSPGYNGGTFTEKWRVWIDFNYDGNFDSTELLIDPAAAQGGILDTLRIPPGTMPGIARMRVAMRWAGFNQMTVPEACGIFDNGEVEDYCVNLKEGNDLYCEAFSAGIGAEWIEQVDIDTTSNISAFNPTGYEFFPNSIFLKRGENVDLRVIPRSLLPQEGFLRIWTDWNQNTILENAELWVDTFLAELDTLSIIAKVPASANLGQSRMRIILRRDSLPEPCGAFSFGEVEDYTLDISEGNSNGGRWKETFNIYPNPSREKWYIQSEIPTSFEYVLFDLSGKAISAAKTGRQKAQVDAHHLDPGIYFLRIRYAGKTHWEKLVKN